MDGVAYLITPIGYFIKEDWYVHQTCCPKISPVSFGDFYQGQPLQIHQDSIKASKIWVPDMGFLVANIYKECD